jgi:Xaa-Pro aminopeptidase
MIITQYASILFVDHEKVSAEVDAYLKAEGVIIQPYDKVFEFTALLAAQEEQAPAPSVWMDPNTLNFALWKKVPSARR